MLTVQFARAAAGLDGADGGTAPAAEAAPSRQAAAANSRR